MADKSLKDLFDLEALSKDPITDFSEGLFQEDNETNSNGQKYVVFKMNNENYAVPSEEVSEVVRMLPLTVIPNLPDWFLGIGNLRGDIVSVIDLAGYWNQVPGEPSQKSKLVVLRSDKAENNLALRVDRLREIVALSEDKIEPASDASQPYVLGVATYKSIKINVLDASKITSSLTLR